jgi:hypothetical protein
VKTTIKNINLSLKGFLTISDAYTLPTVSGGLGDFMMSDGSGGVSWQPASALALTTDDIIEATNLYYTDERVDDRISSLIQNGIGINWSYDDPSNTLTGNVTLAPFSTDDLSEGSNLYYTDERVDDRVSVLIQNNTGISWNYSDAVGTFTPTINISDFTTDDLPQGTTNLYFTNEAIDDRVSALIQNGTGINWTYNDPLNTLTGNVTLAPFSTSDLSEGSNLYYTDERVDDRVSDLIQDSATITWSYNDTLNTLTASAVTTNLVNISKSGSNVGSQPEINFIEGSDISLSVINDGANNRINVTISGTAVSGQPGTVTTIANDGVQIGDPDITAIEFSSKFNVVEVLDTFVQVDIDMSLEELNNVSNVSPLLDWDVLKYNSSLGIWENGNLSEILSLDQLSDVELTSPQEGDGIIYNSVSGQWENLHIAQSLSELDDISLSSPAQSGDILMYNASLGIWENIEGVLSSLLDVSSATPTDLQALKYNTLSGLWQPFDSLYRIEQDSATIKDHFNTLNFKGALNANTGFTPEIIDVSLDTSVLSISDFGDVNLVSPISDGDSLIYNSTLGVWETGSPNVGVTQIQIDGAVQNVSTPTLNFISSDFNIIESPADIFELSINDNGINHDSTFGFVANEHIDHSTVFIIAGDGLSGGGDLTSSRTLNLDIPGLDSLSDASLASDDTLVAYNTSAATHEEVTIAQLSSAVGESLGINPVNGIIYTSSNWNDNTDGTITIPTVDVVLYDDQNWDGTAARFTIAGGTTGTGLAALTDEATNYIYIDYNAGSPQWVITTSEPDYNRSDRAKYVTLYRAGTILHILDWGFEGSGLSNKLLQRLYETNKFQRASGLAISTGGNDSLQVNIDAGDVWNGVHREITPSINSWDDTFFSSYHTAGAWDRTITGPGGGTANNTHYDNGTDLVLLNNNRYVVNWYYKGIESGSHVYEVIGRGQYNSVAAAQLETIPPVPELVSSHAILVGRIICRRGSSTPAAVESAFENQFAATTVTAHNDLSGIQGGTGGEYFHLTNAQHTYLTTNTFVEGTGVSDQVAYFTAAGTISSDSDFLFNGNTVSIGGALNASYKLNVESNSGTIGIRSNVTNNGGTAFFGVSSGTGASSNNAMTGTAQGSTTLNIGVKGDALGASSENIGGYFRAVGATANYSLQLIDGSEGAGKVLTSDANGKATWQTPSTGIGGSGTNNYVARWTPNGITLGNSLIQDNGTATSINETISNSSSLTVGTDGLTASNKSAITGRSINPSTGSNFGIDGVASGGANNNRGGNFLAEASNTNFAIGASVGTTGIGITLAATALDGVNATSLGLSSVIRENTFNPGNSIGGFYQVTTASANDNIGIFVKASNSGIGDAYALALQDGTQGAGKVLTSDALGRATWQTPAGGVGGSGTNNYVTRWTPDGTTLGNSIIQDDGSTVAIGSTPIGSIQFRVNSNNETVIQAQSIANNNSENIAISARTTGTNTTGINIGVKSITLNSTTENIAGYFEADGTSPYALQLIDNTEAAGKFLKSVTADGKANWANITASDISGLGTYALVGSYTNNYVTKWNATTNTLEESLIRDNGNNVAIGAAPNAARTLYVQTSSDIYAIAGQNANTSGVVVGTQGVSINPSSSEVSYGVAGSAGSGSITKPPTIGAGDLVGIAGSAFDSSTTGKLIGALGSVQSSSTASGDAYGVYSFVNASTAINAYAIGIHLNSNASPTYNLGIIENANTGFYSDTDFVMIDAGGVFNFSNINNLTADTTPNPSADYVMTWDDSASAHKKVLVSDLIPYDMSFACGDESTAITVANDLVTLRAPRAFILSNVKASLTTAGSTSGLTTIDVKVNGVSIFSTLLTIDAGETTSATAVAPAVLSTTSIADDAEITVDVTTISGGGTEAGLKVYLIGNLA